MYPQSRESQRKSPEQTVKNYAKKIVTAEFRIPVLHDRSAEGKAPPLHLSWRQGSNRRSLTTDNLDKETMFIRLGVGEDKWIFDADLSWLRSLFTKKTSLPFTLIKGTVDFRLKRFGDWEPFEYFKRKILSLRNQFNQLRLLQRVVESIFTEEQLQNTLTPYLKNKRFNSNGKMTFEMTLTVERVSFSEEEESLLSAQEVKMNNALIPTPPKSDFRIKVDHVEFFVHLKQIKAFSCVSEALTKYVTKSDWSDLLSRKSMQALLRFIYYSEVDQISTPGITFDLMKFGHMYQVPALFKICRERLMTFSEDDFTLDDLFDIYMFVRIPDEFKQLKKHFCRILSENAVDYDTTELKELAKEFDESGFDAVLEILQFVAEDKPLKPSARKRRRT